MHDKFSDSYSPDALSEILKFGQDDDISHLVLRHKDCPHAAKLLWVKNVIKGLLKNKKWYEISKFIQESNVKDLFNDVVKNDFLMSLVQKKISEILSSHESQFLKYIENIPKQGIFVTPPHFPNDFKYDKFSDQIYENLSIPKNVTNECCDASDSTGIQEYKIINDDIINGDSVLLENFVYNSSNFVVMNGQGEIVVVNEHIKSRRIPPNLFVGLGGHNSF